MGQSKKSQVSQSKRGNTFAKKKKKVGKKLVKSNETIISIKTRKIVLPTQHDEKEDQLIFKGKSILDFITGTKHTNGNQRVHNLVNLHEMLSNNLYLIESNAGSLIARLGVILQDPEENVRSAALVLGKLILNHVKSDDLMPFLQIFIVQLSSGMLHIDKGVQKATVQVLNVLLQNHLASSMKYSEPLITSLITLLSTCKNKRNILLYFHTVSYILKFYIRSDSPYSENKVKQSAVDLYKYTVRHDHTNKQDNTMDYELMNKLFERILPHVETIWLEDAPSQVYIVAEPTVLKTSGSIIDLLMLFRRADNIISYDKKSLVKLNSINKSVAGRFPLVCSVPNRDNGMLWQLNMKLAEYLVLIGRHDKAENYFIACFNSRLEELSEAEISQSLDVISLIAQPQATTMTVIQDICVSECPHSSVFLCHFVKHWLHILDEKSDKVTKSLELNIKKVAHDIIDCFYRNKASLVPDIFTLCTDKPVFGSLSEGDQLRCLELYFTLPEEVYVEELSDLGQAACSDRARDKFYSVLQALYHEDRVSVVDYISILLTMANKDDDDDLDTDLRTIKKYTDRLLKNFDILPREVHENLFAIATPQVVERLYTGLSNFSLASYLLIMSRLFSFRNNSHIWIPRDIMIKLCKIICSLIFNKDSLSDWGRDVVVLAVKLSLEHHLIFAYLSQNLGSKSVDMLARYLKVCLSLTSKGDDKFKDTARKRVYKVFDFLQDKISEVEKAEFQYRLSFIYGS